MTRSDELEQAWVSMSRLALRLELQSDSWQTQTTSPSGSLSESLSAWPSAATARGAAADALTPWPVPSASTMAHQQLRTGLGGGRPFRFRFALAPESFVLRGRLAGIR